MFGWFKRRRRRRICRQPFPEAWARFLAERVPYYNHLPQAQQTQLHSHIQVFLAEKNFEGCAGLAMTDDIRLLVAAHACILELRRDTDFYPRLYSVLVYPTDFIVRDQLHDDDRLPIQGDEVRVGEAWSIGAVIFSWDGMLHGAKHGTDGYNVLYHEFAHQIDMENGEADGYPDIHDAALRRDWAEVMAREFERLQRDARQRRRSVLNPYGAEHPAEFFAVATETFFEASARLAAHHPALYEVLRRFYRQDPAALRPQRGAMR